MIAEYALHYGGPPAPDLAWPLFHALLERTGWVAGRIELAVEAGVRKAVTAAFGGGPPTDALAARASLVEASYPVEMVRQLVIRPDTNGGPGDG